MDRGDNAISRHGGEPGERYSFTSTPDKPKGKPQRLPKRRGETRKKEPAKKKKAGKKRRPTISRSEQDKLKEAEADDLEE